MRSLVTAKNRNTGGPEKNVRNKMLFRCGMAVFLTATMCGRAEEAGHAASKPGILAAAAGTTRNGQEDSGQPALQLRNPRYQLCRSDVLDLTFPLTPEFNQTTTVQPDGYITLLGAGDLHVVGQTVPEVMQSIRTAYASMLHDPIVTIQLKDFDKPYFIAGGEVGHPGKYDLRADTTVVEAVAIAGGFTETSKHSEVWVFRRVSNDWVETQKLDVKKMLNAGNLSEDLHLRPGDMLYVPKSTMGKIRRYLPVASLGSYFNPIP